MISISRLYCGAVEFAEHLRYSKSAHQRPVVVWNVTKACNLKCIHCYASADQSPSSYELTTEEGFTLLEDLAKFGVPVILFSGGEPLVRPDIINLIKKAVELNLRVVVSTNGTLIDKNMAKEFKKLGVSYVGISLDGVGEIHDKFRGVKGAFEKVVDAVENCLKENLKVGLRFTINKFNVKEIPKIFKLVREMKIPRLCFYHLVYTGRGANLVKQDLTLEEKRSWIDFIIENTKKLHEEGIKTEVLTVDNHADGPYLYLKMERENNPRAKEVYELLKLNGGNKSGVGIGCISWDGEVFADQFWRHYSFGNIRKRPFSEIWMDVTDPLMFKLKDKKKYVKGRCSKCKFLELCGGNLRVRAEAVFGDPWASDPACYLTDEEIGLV